MRIGGRTGWRVGCTAAGMVLVAGAGCAQQSDAELITAGPAEFAATSEFLGEAVSRSTSQAFRYELTVSMQISASDESIDLDLTMGHGQQDGDRFQMVMDLAAMAEEMASEVGPLPDEPFGDDARMEMVGDDEVLFIHAPVAAELGDGPAGVVGSGSQDVLDVLDDLDDSWGRVDLTQVEGQLPETLRNGLTGGQMIDPRAMFDTVTESHEITDLGSSELDGVAVSGLGATVSFADFVAAQGLDAGTYADITGGDPELGIEGADALVEAMLSADVGVAIWVDADSLVRRLEITLDDMFQQVTDALADEIGAPAAERPDSMEMGFSIDFFDYGDDSIEIEFPDEADTVDITAPYVEAITEIYGS